jgi:glyoxylase-like metal-dependent hydrolase (beta-lactamase superfamily II)
MNKVEILIEGYAEITDTGWKASGTTCLITTDSGLKIITDPGCNRALLLERLGNAGLKVEDIDMVFLTHHHLDHAMLAGIFPHAKVVDEEAVYSQDSVAVEGVQMLPKTDITVLKTPGHEYGHGALIVPTADGSGAIAGDIFWWTTSEEQKLDIEKKDDFAEKMEELVKSRKKVLELADWIVPGHGKMFAAK